MVHWDDERLVLVGCLDELPPFPCCHDCHDNHGCLPDHHVADGCGHIPFLFKFKTTECGNRKRDVSIIVSVFPVIPPVTIVPVVVSFPVRVPIPPIVSTLVPGLPATLRSSMLCSISLRPLRLRCLPSIQNCRVLLWNLALLVLVIDSEVWVGKNC